MVKVKHLNLGLLALLALALLSDNTEQAEFCNEAENCDLWTETSHKSPTGKRLSFIYECNYVI